MAEPLSVVDIAESRTIDIPKTPQYATKMRKKAKDLAQQTDELFIELGRILFVIWDTTSDGDTTSQPLYEKWGYNTFADYVEQELNIDRRRAQRLRRIWYVLEIECAGIPDTLKSNLIKLGTTKLRELCRVIDTNTAETWYERVAAPFCGPKDLTVSEVRDLVKEYLDGGGEEKEAKEEEEDGVPKNEIFSLYPAQKRNLEMAMDAAKVLANNPKAKKGHCLDLICMDFVATNDVRSGANEESRSMYLAKMEHNLGVRLVALEGKKIVYGIEALEELSDDD